MPKKRQPDCAKCDGKCCRSIGVKMPTPRSRRDFENLKWYVNHQGITIFVESPNRWVLRVETPCRELDADNRCVTYGSRPPVCRDFDLDDCRGEDETVAVFRTAADVDAHVLARGRRLAGRRAKTTK